MNVTLDTKIQKKSLDYISNPIILNAPIIASDNSLNQFKVDSLKTNEIEISESGSINLADLYNELTETVSLIHVQVLRQKESDYMVNDFIFSIFDGINQISNGSLFTIANSSLLTENLTISWATPTETQEGVILSITIGTIKL